MRIIHSKEFLWGFWISIVSFSWLSVLIIGNYAYGDDYVVLGMANQSDLNVYQTFRLMAGSPFNGARFVSAIPQGFGFSYISEIPHVQILRFISIAGWSVFIGVFYFLIRRFEVSRLSGLILVTSILLIPGISFTSMSAICFPYSWGAVLALWLSNRIARTIGPKLFDYFLFLAISLVITFAYQPLLNLLLLFPAIKFLKQKELTYRTTITATLAIYISLVVNYLLVKIIFNSSRVDGLPDISRKITLLKERAWPMISIPHGFLFKTPYQFQVSIFVLVILFAISCVLLLRNVPKDRNGRIFCYLKTIGYIPAILIVMIAWLLIVPEDSMDFRRLIGISVVSLVVLTLIPLETISRARKYVVINKFLLSVLVALALIWVIILRVSTTETHIHEWKTAQCASSLVELAQDDIIPPRLVSLERSFREFEFNDEFAIQSLKFPGPQTFLPFFANNSIVSNQKIRSAWDIHFSEKATDNGTKWANAFEECWRN